MSSKRLYMHKKRRPHMVAKPLQTLLDYSTVPALAKHIYTLVHIQGVSATKSLPLPKGGVGEEMSICPRRGFICTKKATTHGRQTVANVACLLNCTS